MSIYDATAPLSVINKLPTSTIASKEADQSSIKTPSSLPTTQSEIWRWMDSTIAQWQAESDARIAALASMADVKEDHGVEDSTTYAIALSASRANIIQSLGFQVDDRTRRTSSADSPCSQKHFGRNPPGSVIPNIVVGTPPVIPSHSDMASSPSSLLLFWEQNQTPVRARRRRGMHGSKFSKENLEALRSPPKRESSCLGAVSYDPALKLSHASLADKSYGSEPSTRTVMEAIWIYETN